MKYSFAIDKHIALVDLEQTSAKIAQGSLLCLAEGVLSLLLLSTPPNAYFFIAGLSGATLLLLATLRFSSSKLGADVSELCFYEVFTWAVALTLYVNQIDPTPCRAIIFAIAPLKLFRIFFSDFLPQNRREIGWAVFGPFTYYHVKTKKAKEARFSDHFFIFPAIIVASLGGYFLPKMETEIVIGIWFCVPLTYVILNGPKLINTIGYLVIDFVASAKFGEEKTSQNLTLQQELTALKIENTELRKENEAKKATLLQHIETFKKKHNLPDDKSALMLATFLSIHDIKRDHLIELAQILAERYPADPSGPAS